jgi:hypothetical protein
LAGEVTLFLLAACRFFSHKTTSRSGSPYGIDRSSTAWTTEKIAVFAPMPSANASNATAVKAGLLRNMRTA